MAFKIPQNIDIYSWWKKSDNEHKLANLTEHQLLNIANRINNLFADSSISSKINLPRLVVVGTQSSGKSSVLNNIMAMDILPTGKNMVTRTPLNIQLNQIKDNVGIVEFDDLQIDITVPTPLESEVNQIIDHIKKKTVKIAGPNMNISDTPIDIKISSPYVPNLSLTDLPGLTMVACIDKGQPEDIKDKIEQLVTKYIKNDNSIIMAVMQSRCDLETDLGLALIKKYDNVGKRTIGILTKPDLMNKNTHIGKYLTNDISKNLMTSHGYYVIKNRESVSIDIYEGFKQEKEYFSAHPEYSKSIYKSRIGINNLTKDLNKLLISSISELLPSVMAELHSLNTDVNNKLNMLGDGIPDTNEGKVNLLNKHCLDFHNIFVDSLESKSVEFNSGKLIKDIFIKYRKELLEINPFNNVDTYNDKYFENIKSSFEGNHMAFYTPPIQILEACISDNKLKPIKKLLQISLMCVDDIIETVIETIKDILKLDQFKKYSLLSSSILTMITDTAIGKLKTDTKNQIRYIIDTEEKYIWTDNQDFIKILYELNNDISSESLRKLLSSYYMAIKEVISHNIPKIIMKSVIRDMEFNLLGFLFKNIVNDDNIELLVEDEKIFQDRKKYQLIINDIKNIRDLTESYYKKN